MVACREPIEKQAPNDRHHERRCRPVGCVVVVAVGLVLLGLAYVIWIGRIGVAALAVGNAVTAVVGLIWLVAGSGFSTAGAVIVAVTVATLAVLAVVQVVTLRA